ncbi:NUDIX domain-containing protein [Paenibacillus sp. MMO-177]|uniref:NUDIX domain-containing protein n=1 Tax=Paenibacillus sp. MMO-177 TaxID=3081289 RepID=UPI00301A0E20
MNTVNRSELQEKYGDEQVMIVLRDHVEALNLPEGFSIPVRDIRPILSDLGVFADRWRVEYNPPTRQPIPYIVVRTGDKFFATTRLDGSGESRLHGKMSLGVGGHINPEDKGSYGNRDAFFNAMIRELHEELKVNSSIESWGYVGVINDNSNPVSQDHLALVYLVDVAGENISVKEVDKLEGGFYTVQELLDHHERLESWSQIVLEMIIRGYIK